MTTPQIVVSRELIAKRLGLTIGSKAADRVVQRWLKNAVESEILRRFSQPVFPDDHTGTRPFVYGLDRKGAMAVSQYTGADLDAIEWKPSVSEEKSSWLFIDHTLAIGDFYLALMRACLEHNVQLSQWTSDRTLKRFPARVEVTLEDGHQRKISLIPDGLARLVLSSGHEAWLFAEVDMGHMTIAPTHWQLRAWRRKFLAYMALNTSNTLKTHFGANSMIVAVVTTSATRAGNLVDACERAGGGEHFWFTDLDSLRTDLFGNVWRVPGKGSERFSIIPEW